jgi:hypothetical protein
MDYEWDKSGMNIEFWSQRNHYGDERITLRLILEKCDGAVCPEFMTCEVLDRLWLLEGSAPWS